MDALAPSTELSRFIAAGDLRRAGEWLVAHYARDVIGLCQSMVRMRDAAEDLAQDAFANAFNNLRGYRAEASPRTWLLSIARNRCIDYLRRTRREPWADGDDEGREPDLFADDAPLPAELLLRRDDLEAALGELAEGERALVVLRFRHGLEYPELASVFGLREGTVRMRLSRALGKMRLELERRETALPAADELEEQTRTRAPLAAGPPAARPAAAAAPVARGAPPPQGFGGPPPMAGPSGPPTGRPAPAMPPPAPAMAPLPPPPRRPAISAQDELRAVNAKGKAGIWQRLRDWFGAAEPPPAPPASVLGRALAASDVEPSDAFGEKLRSLVDALPRA